MLSFEDLFRQEAVPVFLAPMESVSNRCFRLICKEYGADMVYTEFVSSEALRRGVERSQTKMTFSDAERPIGIQLFGNNAEALVEAAQLAQELQPDVIDINWGCPVKKVASKGGGSGILNDIPRMVEITKAVVKSCRLPVSVKTRLGYDEEHKQIVEIAERLQDVGIAALSIHGRTRSQMYRGEADWTLIAAVKNNPRMHIPIIGNGDIGSAEIALNRLRETGVDGLMIGRGAMGNPWLIRDVKRALRGESPLPSPSVAERVEVCRRQVLETVELMGERAGILEMRKLYANYFRGIDFFKPYRVRLVMAEHTAEILNILSEIKRTF